MMKGEAFMAAIAEIAKTMPPPIYKLSRREQFLKLIECFLKARDKRTKIASIGIDTENFTEELYSTITVLMHLAFKPIQVETIEWWLYEDVKKVIYQTKPTKKEYIVETPEQLWDYITTQQSN